MKGIKVILGALAVAGLLGFSFNASAQENGNRDEAGNIVKGAYETNNGLFDNTFINLGVGYNAGIRHFMKGIDLAGKGGLAVDANFGKWFTPSVGARVGWKGISNANGKAFGTLTQNYVHADALWNLSNALSGYKETRFWDLAPYFTTGVLFVDGVYGKVDMDYAAGFGLLNMFRLSDRLDLTLDFQGLVAHGDQYAKKTSKAYPGKAFLPVSATVGLAINLGRTNWDRHSSIAPVVVPTGHTDAQYNALQRRVQELEAENKSLRDEVAALKNQAPDTVYIASPSGDVVAASRTYFDLNSSVLSAREKAHLDFFAKNVIAKAPSNKVFDVIGSADSATGSKAGNEKIALARAQAVADYLIKNHGISASKLNVKSIGGVADYKPDSLNRAVEIK